MDRYMARVESLYQIAFNQLSISMDEDILIYVLKFLQPKTSLQILWKILDVNNSSKSFLYNHVLQNTNRHYRMFSLVRGRSLAHIASMNHSRNLFYDLNKEKSEIFKIHKAFAITQQTIFRDHLNCSDHFDLELLLKLVEVIDCRGQLFTIFQICVQIKGHQFPNKLSDEWIKIQILDNNNKAIFHRIEQGLKLGIFLGDAGWLKECASVLSHVYTLITTKWVCLDRNLELLKIIQCLTKWLLVVSKLRNYIEAKMVLKYMLSTIDIIEKMEERTTISMAYAYVAVSQYYYVLLEFDKAWSWAVKAIHELGDRSSDFLRMSVVNHAIRACSALNKLSTAKKLMDQLHTYSKEICLNLYVDMLLNEAFFSMKAELKQQSINSYLIALDYSRRLFGYYNLHTAIVLVDYAYARYVFYESLVDYNEMMQSLQQGIIIIETLSSHINTNPYSNMLLAHFIQIKALILEKTVLIEESRDLFYQMFLTRNDDYPNMRISLDMRKNLLSQAKYIHKNTLKSTLNTVGVQTLLSAESYSNLGLLYITQLKYKDNNCSCLKGSEKMYLKAIEIKKSILDEDHPEIAISLAALGRLYIKWQHNLEESKQLLLQSSKIFMTDYGYQYRDLLVDLRGLIMVYGGNMNDFALYNSRQQSCRASREAWLFQLRNTVDKNCIKEGLNLENFKMILNGSCGK